MLIFRMLDEKERPKKIAKSRGRTTTTKNPKTTALVKNVHSTKAKTTRGKKELRMTHNKCLTNPSY